MKLIFDFSIFSILKLPKKASIKQIRRWNWKCNENRRRRKQISSRFSNLKIITISQKKSIERQQTIFFINSIQFLLQNNIITVFCFILFYGNLRMETKNYSIKVETFKIIETSSPHSTPNIFHSTNPILYHLEEIL